MDTVMDILMVTPRFLPEMGGIETHVYEVSRRLVTLGHAVTVLTTDRIGHLPPTEQMQGVQVHRVSAWPKRRDYYVAPAIYNRIRASAADVMHVQGYHTFVPPLAMATALRRQMPYVVTFHSGGHSSPLRNALRWPQHGSLAPLVRRAVRLIGVSEFEADFFSRRMRVPRERFAVIRNGAQMPVVEPTAGASPLIVSVGRLERYKGHHRLISALPHLLAQLPQARVRILGDGPYKSELSALAARLGLADRVTIAGIPASDREGVAALLGGAAAVVLLSDYEAHPVAVMEALAMRRRVVVTDCSGLSEMVDGDRVVAVPIHAREAEIASAILDQVRKGPLAQVAHLPTWDDCACRLRDTYEDVIDRHGLR
jgi:glycosyltransferase involved in cell wall biosynthesis